MKTNNMQFLKRLGWNGGKLVWRVFMILLPVVLYSLWQALKNVFLHLDTHEQEQEDYGVYADGTPWVENIEHESWEAIYGEDVYRI